MPTSEIRELTNHFVEQLLPVRIYPKSAAAISYHSLTCFVIQKHSFSVHLVFYRADSTYTEESDFDFYIIVQDAVSDILAETTKAYKSIRKVKQRPVDIVVGTVSRFEARKEIPSIENEVYRKGIKFLSETKKREYKKIFPP